MDENESLPETAAGEVTPVPDAPAAPANPALEVIDRWFNEFFHNSVTSRDPQIFNHCSVAKEELKRRIAAL